MLMCQILLNDERLNSVPAFAYELSEEVADSLTQALQETGPVVNRHVLVVNVFLHEVLITDFYLDALITDIKQMNIVKRPVVQQASKNILLCSVCLAFGDVHAVK